jgi:hypothetical protein
MAYGLYPLPVGLPFIHAVIISPDNFATKDLEIDWKKNMKLELICLKLSSKRL